MIQGYITSVESPDSFVVDQRHILVKPQTSLSWAGDKTPLYPGNIRDALQLGTFVQVYGYTDHHTRAVPAESISIRADWGHKLSGLGVIDKVISSGPEPVFRADGYPLHITSATDLTFSDQLNSLADIGTNTWVQYEARRDLSGAIVVSKATFIPGKPTKFKAVPILEYQKWNVDIPASIKEAGDDSGPEPNTNPTGNAPTANDTNPAAIPAENKKRATLAPTANSMSLRTARFKTESNASAGASYLPTRKPFPKIIPPELTFGSTRLTTNTTGPKSALSKV